MTRLLITVHLKLSQHVLIDEVERRALSSFHWRKKQTLVTGKDYSPHFCHYDHERLFSAASAVINDSQRATFSAPCCDRAYPTKMTLGLFGVPQEKSPHSSLQIQTLYLTLLAE